MMILKNVVTYSALVQQLAQYAQLLEHLTVIGEGDRSGTRGCAKHDTKMKTRGGLEGWQGKGKGKVRQRKTIQNNTT
jgi:hypothetical protein